MNIVPKLIQIVKEFVDRRWKLSFSSCTHTCGPAAPTFARRKGRILLKARALLSQQIYVNYYHLIVAPRPTEKRAKKQHPSKHESDKQLWAIGKFILKISSFRFESWTRFIFSNFFSLQINSSLQDFSLFFFRLSWEEEKKIWNLLHHIVFHTFHVNASGARKCCWCFTNC